MTSTEFKTLFPVEFKHGFTTSSSIKHPSILRVPLEDKALGVHRVQKSTPERKTVDKAGRRAWQAYYPKGSINPSGKIKGGFGFYLNGPGGWQSKLEQAQEVMFGYRVLFQKDFQWVKGGKLPGIFGGIGESAYHCTGGQTDDEKEGRCFNFRLMWRSEGKGEIYAYLMPHSCNTDVLTRIPPRSKQNQDYGFSVGMGSFRLSREGETSDPWLTIVERVKLNDIGVANGELELFINGESKILAKGLILRKAPDSRVQGMHWSTFFGGHTAEWASPQDQNAWFSDLSGAIVA